MTDPKLVVPDTVVGQVLAWAIHAGADVSIEDTRRVLAHHRLVQLPEEPDLVLVTRMVPFEERHIHGIGYAKALEKEGWRITARYLRLPGDPQEVEP